MRKRTILLSMLVFSFMLLNNITRAQRFESALAYMEYIGEQYTNINEELWDYIKAAAHKKNVAKIESRRRELVNTTKAAAARISRLPDYEGDGSYRDSVVAYLNISHLLLDEDYEKIVDLEKIAEESYDLMEAYMEAKKQANEKATQAHERLQVEQQAFADTYGITLIDTENKLSQKLEKANEVYDYYNEIYLIFFKSYKQESYLLDAISRSDYSALEQNRTTLENFASEGIKELARKGSIDGDYTLKQATQRLLTFYKKEAGQTMEDFAAFFLTMEKLQQIQAVMEKKSKSQLTQKEVDDYNKLVKDYNTMVKKYNETNQKLNDERNDLINEWNKVADKFINKHVP
ncbi:MAG: hypothetical protein KDC09_08180 [Bacteroidales bacterium]|nr:hypothetical protein [Bacteroidales bacterium]